jgi:hypothetical protein
VGCTGGYSSSLKLGSLIHPSVVFDSKFQLGHVPQDNLVPTEQRHEPDEQALLAGQTDAQLPQCLASLDKS